MKNNHYTGMGRQSCLVTKSIRYWSGAKANKPKHNCRKKKRGRPMWETERYFLEQEAARR